MACLKRQSTIAIDEVSTEGKNFFFILVIYMNIYGHALFIFHLALSVFVLYSIHCIIASDDFFLFSARSLLLKAVYN